MINISLKARNLLIEAHLALVAPIAGACRRWLPPQFELSDLVSAGNLGLITASQSFNPALGVPFDYFAKVRIRGAIMDFIRREGLELLGVRQKSSNRSSRLDQFDVEIHPETVDPEDPSPEDLASDHEGTRQYRSSLNRALGQLPIRSRAIVISRYADERELKDIGSDHGLSESRICQIAPGILSDLRTLFHTDVLMKTLISLLLILCLPVPVWSQGTNHVVVVAGVKAKLLAERVDLSGPCGAFRITAGVAWELRSEGAGVLEKTSGNNCEGRATDIVMYPSGGIVDILVDGGGLNNPSWNVGEPVEAGRWRAPVDPHPGSGLGTPIAEPGRPASPTSDTSGIPSFIDDVRASLGRVERNQETLDRTLQSLLADLAVLESKVNTYLMNSRTVQPK